MVQCFKNPPCNAGDTGSILVQEDATCRRAHVPQLSGARACELQLEPRPKARPPHTITEVTAMRSLHTATKQRQGVPCSPQPEKAQAKEHRSRKAKKPKQKPHYELETEGNFLSMIRGQLWKTTTAKTRANMACNSKLKTDRLSPKTRNKTRMPAFTTSIQHSCYSVAKLCPTCNCQEKEIKGIYFGKKEIKLVLFTNDMILYIRKLYRFNTTPQKNLIRINEFCKA